MDSWYIETHLSRGRDPNCCCCFSVALSCPALFNPMDSGMPGFSLNSLPLKLGTPVTHMEVEIFSYVNLTRLKDAQR